MLIPKMHVKSGVTMVFEPRKVMQANVPTSPVIGIIPGKEIKQRTHGRAEDIPSACRKQLHASTVRANADNPSPPVLQPSAIGSHSIHEPKISSGNVDPPIHS